MLRMVVKVDMVFKFEDRTNRTVSEIIEQMTIHEATTRPVTAYDFKSKWSGWHSNK